MKRQYKTVEFYLFSSTLLPRGLKHKLLKNGYRVKDYYAIFGTNKNCLVIQFIDNNQTYENLKNILGNIMGFWFLHDEPPIYYR